MLRHQRCLQRNYLILALLGIAIIIYIGLGNDAQQYGSKAIDNLAVSLKLHTPIYVIVIDAGSTASRISAFTFHTSVVNNRLILDETLFYETKPGLSFYAKNTRDLEKSLHVLLDKARAKVPKLQWASTSIILRATAGLRLLRDNEAENILEQCRRVLSSSGFKVSNDFVTIMDGSDEGIFSWFTTNFILDRFSKPGGNADFAKNTVAALDLGGGSTQVTFAVKPNAFRKQPGKLPAYEKNIYLVNAFNRNISVFTKSFLGLGLMAARKDILTHPDNHKSQKGGSDLPSTNSTFIELRSECVNPIITGTVWNYAGTDYLVKGPINGSHKIIRMQNAAGTDERRPVVRFSTCLDIIKKVIDSTVPYELPSLRGQEIYAFSYYFERAAEVGLIDPYHGGMVTVESIYKTAYEICAYPNADQPFMCLDLSFIYVLFRDVFGLDKSSKISMHKCIDGHQLNWALGAAFNVLQNDL